MKQKLVGLLVMLALMIVIVAPVGAQAEQTPQLNLSHIECLDDGRLEIHYAFVHTEETPLPGTLTFTDNGTVYTVGPDKFTGGTWHFSYYAANGYHNITAASVSWNGVTYNLHNPGDYAGDYNCGGTEDPASATVTPGTCAWTEAGGSLTPVTLTIDHAVLTINGSDYTTSTVIQLPPGTYPYTWVAQEGYTGSGGDSIVVGACPPSSASATLQLGVCKWTGESETTVSFTLDHAKLTINGHEYTESGSITLAKGDYPYSWVATEGYTGGDTGTVHLGSCKPDDPPDPPVIEAPKTGAYGPSLWTIIISWFASLFGG